MSTAAVDDDVALYRRSAGGRGTEEDDDDDDFTDDDDEEEFEGDDEEEERQLRVLDDEDEDDDDEEEGLVEDGAFFVFLEGLRARERERERERGKRTTRWELPCWHRTGDGDGCLLNSQPSRFLRSYLSLSPPSPQKTDSSFRRRRGIIRQRRG